MALSPLESQLRDSLAEAMKTDPGLVEDAIVTALSHRGRTVRVACGEKDSLTLRRHRRIYWRGLRRPLIGRAWSVVMEVHRED